MNKKDEYGVTAVAWAAYFGRVEALRILVAAGVLVVVVVVEDFLSSF